jgi:glycosidase
VYSVCPYHPWLTLSRTPIRALIAPVRLLALVLAVVSLAAGPAPVAPAVESVSPPSWFAGHSRTRVQLLVRGSGLSGAQLVSRSPAARVVSTTTSASGGSLIAYVDLDPAAAPGPLPLEVASAAGATPVAFSLEPRLPRDGRFAGLSPDDVVYLLMPDRFADGDQANNDPPGAAGHYDRSNPFAYHGGDLRGVIQRLPYLADLGVTAIWLNPIYDNSDRSRDYHGYGTTDFYDVDEHLGTPAEVRELVERAHAAGIKIVQDQVANHVGPSHEWVADPPTPTWFNGTVSQHLNNTFDIAAIADPNATPARRRQTLEGWFADRLPDLNQNDPETAAYLIQNSLWWIETTGLDAIRQDTLPYVPRTYWAKWMDAIKAEHPRFTVVGEVFNGNPSLVGFFQGGVPRFDGIDSKIDTVFDFALYFAIRDVFASDQPVSRVANMLAQDRFYPDATVLVPFLGNHDVERFATRAGGDTRRLRLALTFLLTTRGTPQIYYGDEIALAGGEDPDNRHDFPGGFPGDRRNAFTREGRSKRQNAVFDHVKRVLAVRAANPALRGPGTQVLLQATPVLAYARSSDAQRAVVVVNNGNTTARPSVPLAGTFADGDRLVDALGSGATASVAAGSVRVRVKPRSALILVLDTKK